jgi:hypothetical protein
MKINEIKLLVNELIICRQEIEVNRHNWLQYTKPLLEAAFNYLKSNLPSTFELQYHVDIFAQNLETVVFSMGSGDSGIIPDPEDNSMPYIKHFGHLVFGQLYNGEISINISLPYIEEIVTNTEQEINIALLKPSELTESKIFDLFYDFLIRIVDWEKNHSKTRSGFIHAIYG